ncbi:hypothetical protein BH23THE1_BH23THE1_20380 [soil metagenome]
MRKIIRSKDGVKRKSLLYLLFAVAGMAIVSGKMVDFVEDFVEDVGQKLGLSELFIGAVIVGILGNTANHSNAITFALKGKMNLALNIGIGSGTTCIVCSTSFGYIWNPIGHHLTLDFTLFELSILI